MGSNLNLSSDDPILFSAFEPHGTILPPEDDFFDYAAFDFDLNINNAAQYSAPAFKSDGLSERLGLGSGNDTFDDFFGDGLEGFASGGAPVSTDNHLAQSQSVESRQGVPKEALEETITDETPFIASSPSLKDIIPSPQDQILSAAAAVSQVPSKRGSSTFLRAESTLPSNESTGECSMPLVKESVNRHTNVGSIPGCTVIRFPTPESL